MTTSVQSLLDRFDHLMHDVGSVRWTQPERLMWINDGQRELIKFKEDANVKAALMNLAAGARQAVPNSDDCYKIISVRAGDTNRTVLPCDRNSLDAFNPAWMASATSDPVKHWMPDENPSVIWVYPSQLSSGGKLLINYIAYPPTVGAGDNLGVRDCYSTNILNYMVYRAYSKDSEFGGNANLAAAAYALFKE